MDAKLSEEEAARVYDFLAKFYDLWSALTEAKARRRALELAEIEDGQNILEAAVGTGTAFRVLVEKNSTGFNCGIDISQKMLKQAKAKLADVNRDNYELKEASAADLPYADGKFDLLFNTYMFDLIPQTRIGNILEEFYRVLQVDGRLVVVNMTEGENFATKTFHQLHSFFYQFAPKLMGGCRPLNLSPHLEAAGFEIISREYEQQLFVPSEVLVAVKD